MANDKTPAPKSPTQLALARVSRELEKVTDELIRLLFEQSRRASPELEGRVERLEMQRDELHDRLDELEKWASHSSRSVEVGLGA
jgi:predicted nuclease with TOPRIM domain